MDTLSNNVGKRVAAARALRHMTQGELAAVVGTNQRVISRIEGGSVDIRISTLRKIADALHLDMSYFLQEQDVEKDMLGDWTVEAKPKKGKRSKT